MNKKIQKAVDKIRPGLQADGGDIEVVGFDEKSGTLDVRLTGMCAHCPMARLTLKEGVEKELKKTVPEVKRVENIK